MTWPKNVTAFPMAWGLGRQLRAIAEDEMEPHVDDVQKQPRTRERSQTTSCVCRTRTVLHAELSLYWNLLKPRSRRSRATLPGSGGHAAESPLPLPRLREKPL